MRGPRAWDRYGYVTSFGSRGNQLLIGMDKIADTGGARACESRDGRAVNRTKPIHLITCYNLLAASTKPSTSFPTVQNRTIPSPHSLKQNPPLQDSVHSIPLNTAIIVTSITTGIIPLPVSGKIQSLINNARIPRFHHRHLFAQVLLDLAVVPVMVDGAEVVWPSARDVIQ